CWSVKMRYSPSLKGFFPETINYPNLPQDLVTISDADYQLVMQKQSEGKSFLLLQNGEFSFFDSVLTDEQIQEIRYAAYVKESDPLFFKWQRGEATKEDWLAKVEEIKARHS
ncbi:MAG: hypothetical protein ACK52I_04575, partial [Pseudomonadota bacterium]